MKKQTLKINKILVVTKEPMLWHYRKHGSSKLSRLPADHRRRLERGEEHHNSALDRVKRELKASGIEFKLMKRDRLKRNGNYDLLMTVGGDGTLLRAAHYFPGIPLLGVNSNPEHSIGFLCRADAEDFGEKLSCLLNGNFRMRLLTRLRLRLNSVELPECPANDILVCHSVPAFQSRYALTVGKRSESQRSSGIWIATAAGSSAALYSAGGRRLPLESKVIQYVVREPYAFQGGYKLRNGCLNPGGRIKVKSHMMNGRIYIDGAGKYYEFGLGSELTIDRSPKPLRLVDY